MSITVNITRTDYKEFNKFVFLRNRLKRSFIIATSFVLLWLIILNINRPFDPLLIFFEAIIFYSIWGIFILLTIFFINWRIQKYIEDNGAILGNKRYIIQEDGFKEISATSESLTKWEGIKKVAENKNYLFVFVDKVAAYIIPKRHFSSEKEQIEFIEALNEKVKK